jgi:hypothetical protein
MYNLSLIKCQEKNFLIDALRGKSKKNRSKMKSGSGRDKNFFKNTE